MAGPLLVPLLWCQSAHAEVPVPAVAVGLVPERQQVAGRIVGVLLAVQPGERGRVVLARRALIARVETAAWIIAPRPGGRDAGALAAGRCEQAVKRVIGEASNQAIARYQELRPDRIGDLD